MNFADCENSLELNLPDILALCETNLDESIDSGNFSVKYYLPLIQKNSTTQYAWSCSLCEGRTYFCMGLISRKFCRFLLVFDWLYFTQVSYFFFHYQRLSASLYTVLDSISCNIDEVLSKNPSANVFVFGDFNDHHKDWLTYCIYASERPGRSFNFEPQREAFIRGKHSFEGGAH